MPAGCTQHVKQGVTAYARDGARADCDTGAVCVGNMASGCARDQRHDVRGCGFLRMLITQEMIDDRAVFALIHCVHMNEVDPK
jgi:hypothetical protein